MNPSFHWSSQVNISKDDKVKNQKGMKELFKYYEPCEKLKSEELRIHYDHSDPLDMAITGRIICGTETISKFTCGFKGENIRLIETTK